MQTPKFQPPMDYADLKYTVPLTPGSITGLFNSDAEKQVFRDVELFIPDDLYRVVNEALIEIFGPCVSPSN